MICFSLKKKNAFSYVFRFHFQFSVVICKFTCNVTCRLYRMNNRKRKVVGKMAGERSSKGNNGEHLGRKSDGL